MSEPLTFTTELNDPKEIKKFLEYINRPATPEEKAFLRKCVQTYQEIGLEED